MSDILIRGMEMPKNCEECDLSKTRHSSLGDIIDCKYIGTVGSAFKDPYNILNARHPKCPLVEIETPYGDLIDRDALIDTLSSSDRDIYVKCMLEENATVVIEGNMDGNKVMK